MAHAASQSASRRRSSTHRPAQARHNSAIPSAAMATTNAVACLASIAPWFSGGPAGEPAAFTHSRTVPPAAKLVVTGIRPVRVRPSGAIHRARTQE